MDEDEIPRPRKRSAPPGEDPADWPLYESCPFEEEDLQIFDRLREQERERAGKGPDVSPLPSSATRPGD